MGPLTRRALTRLPRSGVWGLLVAGAFLLLSTAAASVPMFAEATGNEAVETSFALVPSDAEAGAAPVIRIIGGEDPASNPRLDSDLSRFPGMGVSTATASSIGLELQPPLTRYTSFVAVGPRIGEEAGARLGLRNERARIFGENDLARALVPAPGFPAPRTPRPGGRAVWVPAPVARELQVSPGDRLQIGTQTASRTISTPDVVVTGVYAVGVDGHIPADPPGSRRWAQRGTTLPRDSEFSSTGSYLLVTDIPTANRLAADIEDPLIYSVEGSLDPARPTLAQARRTAAAILARQAEVRDRSSTLTTPLSLQVVSGIPDLVDDATAVANRTVDWTTTAGSAGTGLGLLAVLAVAAFGLARRRVEIRHEVGLGLHPATVGALAALEVLPVAVIGAGLGELAARGLVGAVGPDGVITSAGLRSGAVHAAVAAAIGVLVIAGASAVSAQKASRLQARSAPTAGGRTVPWVPAVLLVAVTATVGLLTRPQSDGPPGYLDLLVPLLILAAIGAVGGRLLLVLAGFRRRGRRSDVQSQLRHWSRRPALNLAVRRLTAGGQATVLLVMVLTIGLGFLIYSFAAAASVEQVSQDRAAVLAGARTTIDTSRAYVLDPGAKQSTALAENEDRTPVPGVRTPPLPAGTTIVWRTRVQVPPEYGSLDLLVIDPKRFAEVAAWGSGPELARARADVLSLAAADAQAVRQWQKRQRTTPIPAIGVGPVLPRTGEEAGVRTREHPDRAIRMLDVLPAFPGYGNLPMIVVPADSFFGSFGVTDPRIAPDPRAGAFDTRNEFIPSLWTTGGPETLRAITQPLGIDNKNLVTLERTRQRPEIVAARQSTGYQLALGVCVAVLAALGLAMFADRAAVRARAADLMLTRIGLGAGGIRRSRALELVFLQLISLALAAIGVAAVVPLGARLLDPGGSRTPAFGLRPDLGSFLVAVLAAVLTLLLALAVSRPRRGAKSLSEVLRDAT